LSRHTRQESTGAGEGGAILAASAVVAAIENALEG
jgi:hypothetical protein